MRTHARGFDTGRLNAVALVFQVRGEHPLKHDVREFPHLTAHATPHRGQHISMSVLGTRAGDVRVGSIQLVDQLRFHQKLQGPVQRRRSQLLLLPRERVEQPVCGNRFPLLEHRFVYQLAQICPPAAGLAASPLRESDVLVEICTPHGNLPGVIKQF